MKVFKTLRSYLYLFDSSGPVGYDPELPSVPTLTLSNLIAGTNS